MSVRIPEPYIDPNKWKIIQCTLVKDEGVDTTEEEGTRAFMKGLVMRYAPPELYPRVLDIGSGSGVELKVLKELGYDPYGIDVKCPNIEYTKTHYSFDNVFYMDMHDLRFPPAFFSSVISRQSFEHSFAPFIHALEVWTVMRPGGRWILNLPSPQNRDMWTHWHVSMFYKTQMRNLFNYCGFKILMALEGGGSKLEYNGGGESYDYVVEKAEPHSDYQHVLRELTLYHQRVYGGKNSGKVS